MEMQGSATHTKTITLQPNEVTEALENSAREGKFMNFTPPAGASVNATLLPNDGAQIVIVYTEDTASSSQ